MVTHPQTLDVIVASNLFGDILTDIGSAISGSLGVAPGGNINPERTTPSMFEPIHGSAPDIAGKGIANPIAAIWAGAMMLDHLGERGAYDADPSAPSRRSSPTTACERPTLAARPRPTDMTRAVTDGADAGDAAASMKWHPRLGVPHFPSSQRRGYALPAFSVRGAARTGQLRIKPPSPLLAVPLNVPCLAGPQESAMQNRRMFLGSAAAAGVGTAVGGTFFFQGTHAQGHGTADPLMAELRRQIADTVIAIRRGRGSAGEHARRMAAQIRLVNAHGVGAAVDAQLRRLLREEGRDSLLAREMDPAALAAELKAIGVERLPALSATYADRARMFDATVRNGMTATLAAFAAGFEQVAPALDRRGVVTVARQEDETCWQWLVTLSGAESLLLEWCALGLDMCWLIVWFFVAYASFMCSLGCACIV